MSQQKKIIYISEEHYNILWNNGAKDGSFTKNGVTYHYDEDATYFVPAPNGGAEIPSDPIFNSIVVGANNQLFALSDSSDSSGGSGSGSDVGPVASPLFVVDDVAVSAACGSSVFNIEEGSVVIDAAGVVIGPGEDNRQESRFTIVSGSESVFYIYNEDGYNPEVSIKARTIHLSAWESDGLLFNKTPKVKSWGIDTRLATEEYVDAKLGDIETLLASI